MGQDLEEGASTRRLVACASLIVDGMKRDLAIEAALIEPLSDDPDVKSGLLDLDHYEGRFGIGSKPEKLSSALPAIYRHLVG